MNAWKRQHCRPEGVLDGVALSQERLDIEREVWEKGQEICDSLALG